MISALTNPATLLNLAFVFTIFTRWLIVPADRERTRDVLAALAVAILAVQGTLPFMDRITLLRPFKYDLYILRFDDLIGDPGFLIAQMARHSRPLYWLLGITYGVLHLAIVVAFTATLYLRPRDLGLLIKCFVLNLILAVPLYMLVPVCGPIYVFRDFPQIHHAITAHVIPLSAACNGIPSVHMSTALLILWFLRHWRWGRIFGGTFAALTVLATLGTDEHYVFDLLCAVPYAAAIYGLCRLQSRPVPGLAAMQLSST